MKIAYILYDKMTTLDFVGFYEAVSWLKILKINEEMSWDFCADREQVTDDRGLTMKIDYVYPDLSVYDLIFIPGGLVTRKLRYDKDYITWIQTAKDVKYKVSVCTGALIWGAAGFLQDKKATTNPSAYDLLEPYCAEVVKERYIRDGNTFTCGGVSASIDLGLFFIESLTHAEAARQVQEKMDYPYYVVGR